jgi:hypothetical protein
MARVDIIWALVLILNTEILPARQNQVNFPHLNVALLKGLGLTGPS